MSPPIPRKLWEHPAPETTEMFKFKRSLEQKAGVTLKDFEDLHSYSVTNRSDFWRHTFESFPLVWHGVLPEKVVDESAKIETNPVWFPGVKLNLAQNILYTGDASGRATKKHKEDDKVALTEVREGGHLDLRRQLTWGELRERVARLASAMKTRGVKKGDRIALVASNSIDTLTVFLAATSLGALFSSSSADMGIKGILDRLLQIRPAYVFFDDWAVYNGKKIDLRQKIKDTIDGMKSIPEFRGVVAQERFLGQPANVSGIARCETWSNFIADATNTSGEPFFEECSFSDPALIVFSSGTTGPPKCIVHAIGGLILTAHKEGRLHHCVDENSVHLQYTTTGWIMYVQVPFSLLLGAHPVLYDGSPFFPDARVLLNLVGDLKITHLGISPRYLEELQREKIIPREMLDLSHLKVVVSTGMVLPEALFEWFYDVGFPAHTHLGNISGGTDIAACFTMQNPLMPLYAGGCQHRGLGMDVQAFDPEGKPLPDGEAGELVCVSAFPTMPIGFFGPGGQEKYFNSYFARFPSVWTHGDFIQVHPHTKQVTFLGRSDGVLNPSGVRFGSAEIYNVLNAHFADRIADSICVGQRRPQDSNERVLLFVLMKEGHKFTKSLVRDIKQAIRTDLSPRHVPAFVFETPEIPTTVNMKKVELPVKQIVSGLKITPSGTLANPQSLDYYYQFADDKRLNAEIDAKL
ncbi:Acetoacetyl-CoA synthetase [Scedosporium apiospermum]|uniref:Acetoacetyl-CoA synthetase n=1 Tax=Pseudallescheria apiosperma TaxID=563466 RepID=A0A084GC50_PSEDA|nr:Acetoacetyl-CoA synthetase [Scedosporium apiospermum]KEZ44912.1 Acetoacetyl-CoA synthetase [Scedosporium apiospermum]